MKIDLVTGGAGFIGSHLVHRLIDQGRSVRVVDDLSTGHPQRLAGLGSSIELVVADLATADLAPLVAGVGRIFHLAAVPSVPRSVVDPLRTHRSVADATLRLLIAARDQPIERFVLSSSSSVYGDSAVSPKNEDLPIKPLSPYAVAKATAEGYARVFGSLYGLKTVVLRYFNVFGPDQDPHSQYAAVIPLFITLARQGAALPVFGDGLQTRDFTYVDNVVSANIAAAGSDVPPSRVYNIAAGSPRTVKDLIHEIERVLGRSLEMDLRPARPGDIRHSHADISAASRELGWSPTVPFAEGLHKTIEWYLAH